MGPKRVKEFDDALRKLERDVFQFLIFDIEIAGQEGPAKEEAERFRPLIPELYLMYRKMLTFGSPHGLPMLVSGGWYEQPYITSIALEACHKAHNEYLKLERALNEQRAQS